MLEKTPLTRVHYLHERENVLTFLGTYVQSAVTTSGVSHFNMYIDTLDILGVYKSQFVIHVT